MNLKKILAGAVSAIVALSTLAVAASAENAGFIFQTTSWSFRNTLAQSNAISWDEFDEAYNPEGCSFSDVEVTGDGTYTVSVTGIPDEGLLNLLILQTDIDSEAYPDVQITIDKCLIDGVETDVSAAELSTYEYKSDDYADEAFDTVKLAYRISLYHNWDHIDIVPVATSAEVTFTVSGFGGAAADSAVADEAPAEEAVADEAPVVDTTVAAGDTTVATSDKASPDTGVEGIAAIVGLGLIAVGAVVVTRKKK